MLAQVADPNAFLAQIAAADYELLRPHLTAVGLKAGERLLARGARIEQVVFPHSGLLVLTMPLGNGGGGGAILLGSGGLLEAFEAAAAAPALCDAEVLIGGQASRITGSRFVDVLDRSPAIRRLTARYNAAGMVQAHQTALCNAAHPVEARVARLLLEIQDRCGDTKVPLTQTRLSQLLGVQRTTVNLAAGNLQDAGMINCRRGCVEIVRREALERRTCECYLHL